MGPWVMVFENKQKNRGVKREEPTQHERLGDHEL